MTRDLEAFSPATRDWFQGVFAAPTSAQAMAWESISSGHNTLVVAPTGSGKTLAAFLWAIDSLLRAGDQPEPSQRTRVLYVSPLKALAVDIERNLRAPLSGIQAVASRTQQQVPELSVAVRSGDTPAKERQRFLRAPSDILITTPESLYLLLTSRAREVLQSVETVIIDEVHAVAGTKRGAHLAVTLERLDAQLSKPAQRIGLSATVRPVETVARFLGGPHPVQVVQPSDPKPIDLKVVVPVEDLAALDTDAGVDDPSDTRQRASVWPHVEASIVDLVADHRSTIVFANSRRLAERLSARLNEDWFERSNPGSLPAAGSLAPAAIMASGSTRGHDPSRELARAHHGSVSREQRQQIEEDLKQGLLPAVVATSSLELGIDMGAVDLVIQVESPPSVASGLQRVGRAEHRVDGVSRGVIFPKHRGDLLPTAVTVERMRSGQIEALSIPANPLDVLAQQVVAMVAMDEWTVADLAALIGRAAPFQALPASALEAVLDMLAGRYPSDAFAELRPRLVWDRDTDTLTARPGAHRLAVTSGGTIPDRGLYGVFLVGTTSDPRGGGRRVGELDEEMVYESRVGDVFALGATSWRIEEITHDQVLVSPAPGQPGRLPFWHGDAQGRPAELGRAMGAFTREVMGLTDDAAKARLSATGLDEWAVGNLLSYMHEQRDACQHLPDDRTVVIERFRDEIGDWRLVIHSPFGGRVNTPWSLAIAARMRDDLSVDVQVMPSDDGIVMRLPDIDSSLDEPPSALRHVVLDADEVESAVTHALSGSALFASRFRECAGRALLLPRRRPDKRTPLWQQRQRSAQLLSVASEHSQFPIVLETMRECLQDVFDVPGLRELMRTIADGSVRVVEVETVQPSPYARSLLFSYVGAFLYEGDAPLAERRAQALALDTTLLAELLGQAELRELLDPAALSQVEAELQRLTPERAARDAEDTADLLRILGPLTTDDAQQRGVQQAWLTELAARRRVVEIRVHGSARWAAVEDVSRLRDGLGVPPPMGVANAFLEPVADPIGDLVSRYARTHGPFKSADLAHELGAGIAVVEETLRRLVKTGRITSGEFRPGGSGIEWCDAEVLRLIRRRSLALLRREVEPVPHNSFARFLPHWQGIGNALRGTEGVLSVVEQFQGAYVPASALETSFLPSRVVDYSPAFLDELTSA
ncbi:MAG: DEAD/DEAH box helicase, partial [Candidatus Nanopelagicales bacterium]